MELSQGDFYSRHEPPVLAGDISILQNEVDVVTICKPPSVPVHPCGQYRKNTVVGILQAEHGGASVRSIGFRPPYICQKC